MSVGKIVELTATGSSIEDAVATGVSKAGESLRNIEHVWVDGIEAFVEDGKVARYHVHLKLTFVID
jgi:dodecin